MTKKNILIFVGGYSEPTTLGTRQVVQGKCEGIYVFRMNPETGELTLLSKGTGKPNATYLTLDRTKKILYSTNELKEYEGLKSGAASSFSLDSESGKLTFLNRRATGGTDAVHLMVNDANTHLLVANFMSGSVCVFPIAPDGSLEHYSCFLQHKGSSINPIRQKGPHAHGFELDKSNKHAFVPDLGTDKVYIYKTDFENGHLYASDPAYMETKKGEGPRHCIFHPSGKCLYVINEMGSSIYAYHYDENAGNLKLLQIISTLPDEYNEHSTCAAIKILPKGRYLYGSNRGHDSLATYKIDEETGKLTLISIQSTGGSTPRDFDFDPEGNFLLVANQASNNIVIFKVNRENGNIREVSRVNNVFTPTCIRVYSMNS